MQDKIQKNNLAVHKGRIVDLMFVLDSEVFSPGLNIGPFLGAIFKQNGDTVVHDFYGKNRRSKNFR